jgi:rhamnosyltransferase
MPFLPKVFAALKSQQLSDFEVIVIDSGSTDGSLESVPRNDPRFRFEKIPPEQFGHGRTRNLGVGLSRAPFCAFLTQDAIPADNRWLQALVAPLQQHGDVAGVFGRHIAHPNASPFTQFELERHFNFLSRFPLMKLRDPDIYREFEAVRQLFHFYSDNSSCLRKTVWYDIPYPDVSFAEDQVWAKQIIEAGYAKAYAHDSVVWHSHDYNSVEIFRRTAQESASMYREFAYYHLSSFFWVLPRSLRWTMKDVGLALRHGWLTSHPGWVLRRPIDNVAKAAGHWWGIRSSRRPARDSN